MCVVLCVCVCVSICLHGTVVFKTAKTGLKCQTVNKQEVHKNDNDNNYGLISNPKKLRRVDYNNTTTHAFKEIEVVKDS